MQNDLARRGREYRLGKECGKKLTSSVVLPDSCEMRSGQSTYHNSFRNVAKKHSCRIDAPGPGELRVEAQNLKPQRAHSREVCGVMSGKGLLMRVSTWIFLEEERGLLRDNTLKGESRDRIFCFIHGI